MTEAAKCGFERQFRRHLDRVKRIALNILIWGPSVSSFGPVVDKRKQIHKALIEAGHNAMFSEDFPLDTQESSLKMQEFAQARAADLIIVLVEDSPGALAEAHDFCNHPNLAEKFLIMFPQRMEAGYSARGAIQLIDDGFGGVHWYQETELFSCHVLTIALRRAEARRIIRALHR
jgi:hypothetical protein